MIAAGYGYDNSVKNILLFYKAGHTTKEDYRNALQAYQTYLDEIRSEQRDKAAAFSARVLLITHVTNIYSFYCA